MAGIFDDFIQYCAEDTVNNGDGSRRNAPDDATLHHWIIDGVAEALDGCRVEPDGYCEHGEPSWLIQLGLI